MMLFFLENAALFSLLFFFTVFVSIAIRVLRPSAKRSLEQLAQIPLENE